MRTLLTVICLALLQGCTSWNYEITDEAVAFEVRSWNHGPLDYPVEGADIPTFRELDLGYALDRNRVYYKGSVVEGADPETFVILKNGYSKDDFSVFLLRCIVQSADPVSFMIIQGNWAKDNDHVFYADRSILDADPTTIRVVGDCWAIDHQRAYQHIRGFQVGCDIEGRRMSVRIFSGIDAETFEVLDCFHARDSLAEYNALGIPNK